MKPLSWRRFGAVCVVAALAALTARAYVLMDPPYWADGTVTLVSKLGTSPVYSNGATPNATAHAAALAWNPYMVRVQLATTTGTAGAGGDRNGTSEVFFSSTVYGYDFGDDVLAVTLVASSGNRRTEADVVVNNAERWDAYHGAFNGFSYDLRRVLVHEFGHVLGLDHPDEANQGVSAVMNSHIGDIETPTDDDQDGVAHLYGDGRVPPPEPPTIIVQPQSYAVNPGDYVLLSVQAGGTDPLSYQWYKDGVAIPGATVNSYSIAAMAESDVGSYSVVVTNVAGQVTSTAASLTLNPPVAPYFSNVPSAWVGYAHVGDPLEIGAQIAYGTDPITYQWFKNGLPIAGATEHSLSFASASATDAGIYTLVASNVAGSAVYHAGTVVMLPQVLAVQISPPTNSDGVLQPGDPTTGTSEFQWYKNGQPIPGATQAAYGLSTAERNEAADYVVTSTNSAGTVASHAVHVGPAFSTDSTWASVSPVGLAYTPSEIVLGADGFVYLLSRPHGNVFRWSPASGQYVGTLPLSGSANAITYDQGASMLYAGYADGRITRVDPAAASGEAPFVAASSASVEMLAMTGDALLASTPNGPNTQAVFTTYDRDARRVGAFANGQLSPLAWDAPLHRIFYIQYYGMPLWTTLVSGVVNSDGTLGAFGGGSLIATRFPICVSPDGNSVLIGTGTFYGAATLAASGSLPVQIDAAAWLDGYLYTLRDTVAGARIERWASKSAVDRAGTIPGRTLQLFALANHQLLAVVENSSAPQFVITNAALDNIAAAAPEIITPPVSAVVQPGGQAALSVAASTGGSSCQWTMNGVALAGATDVTLGIDNFAPTNSGIYQAVLTATSGTALTTPAILGLSATAKVTGLAGEVGPNIRHPNGNYYDQVLLQGSAASITADVGQVTRTSYIDLNGDIVQVEFAGAGTLSLVLSGSSAPAAPANYNQPGVSYMTGHAGIVITGADKTTNVSVFTVGRATAFDPTSAYDITKPISSTNDPAKNGSPLFQGHGTTNYDGVADLRYIAILSRDGYFGGLRASNANFFADAGPTGIYAPGVNFVGPVYVGNIDAHAAATPVLILGSAADTRITGGDLAQTNQQPVEVSGLTQLEFTAGTNSAGTPLPAQQNQARLEQDGNDVTDQIVVNPSP
ncbi:MAG TPA: immunoglobulin domain-containing protein [Opitutus sp.]|nr:immunoglobulin domain-containing protein [Opitutus sp.]